ncbi:MAG TPA: aldolase/citrate lyase family protein [Microvirga sp.]|jgi:4-hydroxy-2-oxoheptanedioate aldolase|nr:aldolase/citrate lyase family protein [Microvirga sp.]
MSAVAALSQRLRSGATVVSAWCAIPDPMVAGLLASEGFDTVTLDLQHGGYDVAAAMRAIPHVAAAGKPAAVRIPVRDFASASRLLDCGAAAVIAPMINTVEDAQAFAAHMKYPPIGTRSWGPMAAMAITGQGPDAYFAAANETSLAFAMVETREALRIVDDILAVPGIDGLFVGPADLSIALSGGAGIDPFHPEVEAALDHVARRARAAGKFAAVYAFAPERVGALFARGFHVCAVGMDIFYLRAGAQDILAKARG